jgi:purine nucleoside permease
MSRLRLVLLGLAALLAAAPAAAAAIAPKVVIISYFETSKLPGQEVSPSVWGDSGGRSDRPGELRYWVEREHLTRVVKVRGAFNPAYLSADGSILAMKVGPNSLHPAVNITALGLDPQFDLSKSYWLFNGIAGISPGAGTIGDLVWTDFVVNGDVGHEIDAREIPSDWTTGYFPAGKQRPYQAPRVAAGSREDVRTWRKDGFNRNGAGNVIALNRALAGWALKLTAGVKLPDDAVMQAARRPYAGFPAALAPSRVRLGATLSAETFWHGALLDRWATDWTRYMTDGEGGYVTTETNDARSMVAISALAAAGRVDPDRVMLLRGASNFDMPPPGVTAAQGLADQGPGSYAGYLPALEGAYRTGSVVVHALVEGWDRYSAAPPK